MKEIKDTVRAIVRVGYDGRVHKTFRGTDADKRYANERRVLEYLELKRCDFVPRVLDYDDDTLYLVTSNCGQRVTRLSDGKMQRIFDELEEYGVRHGDQAIRNITYHTTKGRFCVIDFELSEIIDEGYEGDTRGYVPPPKPGAKSSTGDQK